MMLGGDDGDQEWIDEVVTTVGLADRLKHRPSELSGGQQQRVAVARALATQAGRSSSPTSRPATSTRHRRRDLDVHAQRRRRVRQTIVMVTHDPTAASYADRVVFLGDGKIVRRDADPTAGACSTG